MIRGSIAIGALLFLFLSAGEAGAANKIFLSANGANAGTTGVAIEVSITNDTPIHGFSLALSYDPENLVLSQITLEGTAVAGAEFFSPSIDGVAGTAVVGVILSYNEPYSSQELAASPDVPQRVLVLTFNIAAGAPPGDYPIVLIDGIGSPPISNRFTIRGTTIHPILGAGAVTVNNLNKMKMESLTARPGSPLEVKVFGQHPSTIQGYSVAFTHEKVLTHVDVTYLGTDVQMEISPSQIEFFLPRIDADFSATHGRVALGVVVDNLPPFTGTEIPAAPNRWQSLARFRFNTSIDVPIGTSTALTFHEGAVDDVNNIFIIDKESYPPAFIHGSVLFTSEPTFRRGYVNADSRFDISDVIGMLEFMFLGGATPLCMNATDLNDDERFDLSDIIYMLSYIFLGGNAPFDPSEVCGLDPTPGNLGCEQPTKGCQ